MVDITAETPRSKITISGLQFDVPEPYTEGHVLTANEASTLNQTYAENIRNNNASRIAEEKELATKEGREVDVAKLQSELNDYIASYEFGQRRGSSGDPVERKALEIARDLVRNKIREKGGKLSDYKPSDITARATEVLEKFPAIRERAKAQVEAEQAAASELAASVGEL